MMPVWIFGAWVFSAMNSSMANRHLRPRSIRQIQKWTLYPDFSISCPWRVKKTRIFCYFLWRSVVMALEILYSPGLYGSRRYNPIFDPSLHCRSPPSNHSRSVPRKSVCVRISCSFIPVTHRSLLSTIIRYEKGSEFAEVEVMEKFVNDRQINGDFVSKIYDNLWRKDVFRFADKEVMVGEEQIQQTDLELEGDQVEIDDGFLKLSKTMEWVSSENIAPINRKFSTKKSEDDGEKRKKVNNLKYEVLKGELMLLTVGIGAACAVCCLISLSTEAAISYSIGVLLSCLYLQLLCTYADNLSKASIPGIFIQKKVKKIGIRGTLEKTLNGTNMALSSPRLVLPVSIYGLWALSHQYFNIFDFQLVPAMLGFFAYKAAALVQVYRDNEDLGMVFPNSEDNSKHQ